MSEEKSVEDYLDEAVAARLPQSPAEDEGTAATPDTGKNAADQASDEGEDQESKASEAEDEGQEGQESEDTDGEDEQPKPKPQSKVQKRIRRLVRERDEANQRLAEREAEIRVLIAQSANGRQQAPQAEPAEDAAPKQEDYQDYAKYLADVSAWAARQETKKVIGQIRQEGQESARKSKADAAEAERVAKAKAVFAKGEDAFEDFGDLVGSSGLKITNDMFETITEMDDGHKVAYHLGQNPDEAERIAGLSRVAQVRELVGLEAKLTKPMASKKTTSASAPIKPVKAGGAPRQFDPDTCSMKEYMQDYHRRRAAGDL